jgi:type IV secretion system protein TrbC
MSRKLLKQGASLAAMVLLSGVGAFAQNQGGNLPWEGPLQTLVTSLTGPVAYAISVVAIVALGAGLAFGGEMSESMRRMLQVGVAVCLVVFAAQVMTSWIGSGAETDSASALPIGLLACAFASVAALTAWLAESLLAALMVGRRCRAEDIEFPAAA